MPAHWKPGDFRSTEGEAEKVAAWRELHQTAAGRGRHAKREWSNFGIEVRGKEEWGVPVLPHEGPGGAGRLRKFPSIPLYNALGKPSQISFSKIMHYYQTL